MARTSRQHDDANGAHDAGIDMIIGRGVDVEVQALPVDQRESLRMQAYSLAVGAKVFMHPRLPADKQARQAILNAARLALWARLVRASLV